MITFEDIRHNEEVNTYIRMADRTMVAMGFTEHSFAHMTKIAVEAGHILEALGYNPRVCELARIAGYMHDIGNMINRYDHAQSGAVMAFTILTKLGMPPDEIAVVTCAIGNHDEKTAVPVNAVSSVLILADKMDVRRTRVRDPRNIDVDIHDRVNFAVTDARWDLNLERKELTLRVTIDNTICPVMDFFEIFLDRMLLCRKAADFLGLTFRLEINGSVLL